MANSPVKPSRKKLWAIIGIAAVVIAVVASVFYIMNSPITQPAPRPDLTSQYGMEAYPVRTTVTADTVPRTRR